MIRAIQTVSIAAYYVFYNAWTPAILKRKAGYCGLYICRRNYVRLRFPKPKPSRAMNHRLHIALVITLCIITANDVQLNPGPPNSCTICDLPVVKKDLGIYCDECGSYVHPKCSIYQRASMFGFKLLVISGIVMHAGFHVHYVMVTFLKVTRDCSVTFAWHGITQSVVVYQMKHTKDFKNQCMDGFARTVSCPDIQTHSLQLMT